jgi:hypothetical protein
MTSRIPREVAIARVRDEIDRGLIQSTEEAERRFMELGHAVTGKPEKFRQFQRDQTLLGKIGRFANRAEARTTQAAANLAEAVGIVSPEKAEDVRTIAREIESRYRPAQTTGAKIAGGLGTVAPDIAASLIGARALPAVLGGVSTAARTVGAGRTAVRARRAAKAVRTLGGPEASLARRAAIGAGAGAAVEVPLFIAPGAMSDDPRQSLTGQLAEASRMYQETGAEPETFLGRNVYAPIGRAAEELAQTKTGRLAGDITAMLPLMFGAEYGMGLLGKGVGQVRKSINYMRRPGPELGPKAPGPQFGPEPMQGPKTLDDILAEAMLPIDELPAPVPDVKLLPKFARQEARNKAKAEAAARAAAEAERLARMAERNAAAATPGSTIPETEQIRRAEAVRRGEVEFLPEVLEEAERAARIPPRKPGQPAVRGPKTMAQLLDEAMLPPEAPEAVVTPPVTPAATPPVTPAVVAEASPVPAVTPRNAAGAVRGSPAATPVAEATPPIAPIVKPSPEVRAAKGSVKAMLRRSKELARQAAEIAKTGIKNDRDVAVVAQMVEDINAEIANLNAEISRLGSTPVAAPVRAAKPRIPEQAPEALQIPPAPKSKSKLAKNKYITQLRNIRSNLSMQLGRENILLEEQRALRTAIQQVDDALEKAGFSGDANMPMYYAVNPMTGYVGGYALGDTPEERDRYAMILGGMSIAPALASKFGKEFIDDLIVTHQVKSSASEFFRKAVTEGGLGGRSLAVTRGSTGGASAEFGGMYMIGKFADFLADNLSVYGDDIWAPTRVGDESIDVRPFATQASIRRVMDEVFNGAPSSDAGINALRVLAEASQDGPGAVREFANSLLPSSEAPDVDAVISMFATALERVRGNQGGESSRYAAGRTLATSAGEVLTEPHVRTGPDTWGVLSEANVARYAEGMPTPRLGRMRQNLRDTTGKRIDELTDEEVFEEAAREMRAEQVISAAGSPRYANPEEVAADAAQRIASEIDTKWASVPEVDLNDNLLKAVLAFKKGAEWNRAYSFLDPADREQVLQQEIVAALGRAIAKLRDANPAGQLRAADILKETMAILPPSRTPRAFASAMAQVAANAEQILRRPVTYFESFNSSVIPLDKFRAFLLPLDTPALSAVRAEIIDKLPDAIIKEYNPAVVGARTEAMKSVLDAIRNNKGLVVTAGGMAVSREAQAQDGSVDEGDGIPWGAAILLATGVFGYKFMRGALGRAAREGVKSKAARAIVEQELQRQARMQASKTAAATAARNAARIGQPVAPYSADLLPDLMDSPESMLREAPRILNDRAGSDEVREISEGLIETGLVPRGMTVPWEVETQIAEMLATTAENLATRDPARKLSGPEMLALSVQYKRDIQRAAWARKLMNDQFASAQDRELAARLVDALEDRVIQAYTRITRDASQTGRDLNLLKLSLNSTDDPAAWLLRAQKLAGGRQIDDELVQEILGALRNGDIAAAQRGLAKARAKSASIFDRIGEGIQAGLLLSFARPLRDIISNTTQMADRVATLNVLAPAFDQLISGLSGTRTAGGLTSPGVRRIAKAGLTGAKQAWLLMNPTGKYAASAEGKALIERASRRYDWLRETQLQNPVLRAVVQWVRRSVAAADQPFYEVAYASSIESQARAMALGAGYKGRELARKADALANRPTSQMLARAASDAMEATWQNDTRLTAAAKWMSMRASKQPELRLAGVAMLPFAQTPSAMASEAIGRTPLGVVAGSAGDLRKMANATLRDEAQRRLVRRLALGFTGGGWIYLGYQLAANGDMTGAYPVDPNERARWDEENKVPNAIRRGGKWTALSGLLGPQAMLMGVGAQLHEEMTGDGGIVRGAIDMAKASATGIAGTIAESPYGRGASALGELMQAAKYSRESEVRDQYISRAVDQYGGMVVPQIVSQLAQAVDVDENGNIISRDIGQGEGMFGRMGGAFRSRIPGLRESLPVKVSPFGRVRTESRGGLISLFDPMRSRQSFETDLTQGLGAAGYFPTPGKPDEEIGETPADFLTRRMAQGPQEEALLYGIMLNEDAIAGTGEAVSHPALNMLTQRMVDDYRETGNRAELYRSVLDRYRSLVTDQRREPFR